jgi:mannose-6-phosphate isomerase-like protein (cupin superfamily)
MAIVRFARQDRQGKDGLHTRRIGDAPAVCWVEPVFIEWELTRQSWSDRHPFTEHVYVLEGRLFVESGGQVVECGPGDLALVTAHSTGRYWAPDHARMLSVYGPNPNGLESIHYGLDPL